MPDTDEAFLTGATVRIVAFRQEGEEVRVKSIAIDRYLWEYGERAIIGELVVDELRTAADIE
jgi:hypothetical protein